jgi:hypothetical protein
MLMELGTRRGFFRNPQSLSALPCSKLSGTTLGTRRASNITAFIQANIMIGLVSETQGTADG